MIYIKKTYGSCFLHYAGVFGIDWPASSIAIVGPNGTGKTTIARALIWSFIGRFPTPPIVSRYVMDLPRPGSLAGLKKSPDTVVTTEFDYIGPGGDRTEFKITRRLTADKKTTLSLESLDGVVKLSGQAAQNQVFVFAGVSHGATIDECSKLFIRKHWFGVDQDLSIFTSSPTERRELLESTNPLALLPRMEEDTAKSIKTETKYYNEIVKGISSCLGSVDLLWKKVGFLLPLETGDKLLTQKNLDADALTAILESGALVQRLKNSVNNDLASLTTKEGECKDFIKRLNGESFSAINKDLLSVNWSGLEHAINSLSKAIDDSKKLHLIEVENDQITTEAAAQKESKRLLVEGIEALAKAVSSDTARVAGLRSALRDFGWAAGLSPSPGTPPATFAELAQSMSKISTAISKFGRPTVVFRKGSKAKALSTKIAALTAGRASVLEAEKRIQEILDRLEQISGLGDLEDLANSARSNHTGVQMSDVSLSIDEAILLCKIAARPVVPATKIDKNEAEALERALATKTSKESELLNIKAGIDLDISSIKMELRSLDREISALKNVIQRYESVTDATTCEECGSAIDAGHRARHAGAKRLELTEKETLRSGLVEAIERKEQALQNTVSAIHQCVKEKRALEGDVSLAVRRLAQQNSEELALRREASKWVSAIDTCQQYVWASQASFETNGRTIDVWLRDAFSCVELVITDAPSYFGSLGVLRIESDSPQIEAPLSSVVGGIIRDLLAWDSLIKLIESQFDPMMVYILGSAQDSEQIDRMLDIVVAAEVESNKAALSERKLKLTDIESCMARLESRLDQLRHEMREVYNRVGSQRIDQEDIDSALTLFSLLQSCEGKAFAEPILGRSRMLDVLETWKTSAEAYLDRIDSATKAHELLTEIQVYLKEATNQAMTALEKSRKIEALSHLKTLLTPNGSARTMVVSSVAAAAFEEANQSIKRLGLNKDLHVGVEVVSLEKEGAAPQPALDVVFTVDGVRANLPSNSQGLQVSLALDLAVQSQGGWGGFFIVDEPEQGLDSQTMGKITQWLRGLNRQVVILTNSGADNFEHIKTTAEIGKLDRA